MIHYLYSPATPNFGISQEPDVEDITSSSAVVRWPKANDIPSGLESYYYYVVWLHVDGQRSWRKPDITQSADMDHIESSISGLAFNTHYSVKVKPYRQHNGKHEGGKATDVATFKTSCIGTVKFSIRFRLL